MAAGLRAGGVPLLDAYGARPLAPFSGGREASVGRGTFAGRGGAGAPPSREKGAAGGGGAGLGSFAWR